MFVATGLCAVLVGLSGCGFFGDTQSNAGAVAVVDLDEVAKRLGRDVEMNKSIKIKAAILKKKLAQLQSAAQTQFEKEKAELGGKDATPEQKKQLQSIQVRISLQLKQLQRTARAQLAEHRQQLVNQFREEVKPTVRTVAADNGLSIVIPKDKNLLLSVEPGSEITDKVVEKLMASSSGKMMPSTTSSPTKPEKTASKKSTSAAN